ncbi:uncharacterized protein L969DRAFT_44510 [Mixia osmundae IAM 14324]|uniref:Uncharacterized protein n=1 Tax=Mixia osmundae (strain CBS 9802 / IAM 14324 / JCM 22182 / KY 12970) TaxID=764103 RepID=G7DTV0_MIXOS|nr:uncharacterized protein L969DRAFT_44510 [Mixia osmundae IAM 14324]KEI41724.1 hypothetical protein L969DRAFT_44510 [Mixia osmundae IAM 14324]GAA94010.1 hypothetical protein E5Q_00657 [Mixia osmundae IAM 14324]
MRLLLHETSGYPGSSRQHSKEIISAIDARLLLTKPRLQSSLMTKWPATNDRTLAPLPKRRRSNERLSDLHQGQISPATPVVPNGRHLHDDVLEAASSSDGHHSDVCAQAHCAENLEHIADGRSGEHTSMSSAPMSADSPSALYPPIFSIIEPWTRKVASQTSLFKNAYESPTESTRTCSPLVAEHTGVAPQEWVKHPEAQSILHDLAASVRRTPSTLLASYIKDRCAESAGDNSESATEQAVPAIEISAAEADIGPSEDDEHEAGALAPAICGAYKKRKVPLTPSDAASDSDINSRTGLSDSSDASEASDASDVEADDERPIKARTRSADLKIDGVDMTDIVLNRSARECDLKALNGWDGEAEAEHDPDRPAILDRSRTTRKVDISQGIGLEMLALVRGAAVSASISRYTAGARLPRSSCLSSYRKWRNPSLRMERVAIKAALAYEPRYEHSASISFGTEDVERAKDILAAARSSDGLRTSAKRKNRPPLITSAARPITKPPAIEPTLSTLKAITLPNLCDTSHRLAEEGHAMDAWTRSRKHGYITPPTSESEDDLKDDCKLIAFKQVPAPHLSDFTFERIAPAAIEIRSEEIRRCMAKISQAKFVIRERTRKLKELKQLQDAKSKLLAEKAELEANVLEQAPPPARIIRASIGVQTGEVDGKVIIPRTYVPLMTYAEGESVSQRRKVTNPSPKCTCGKAHCGNAANGDVKLKSAEKDPSATTKSRKGRKKKRDKLANAKNPHYRDNYVPSRTRSAGTHAALSSMFSESTGSMKLKDYPDSSITPHPQLGASKLVPWIAGQDEWICSNCEYKLLYGPAKGLSAILDARNKVLKVRTKAQERASRAANGKGPTKGDKKSNRSSKKVDRVVISVGTQTDASYGALASREPASGPGKQADV